MAIAFTSVSLIDKHTKGCFTSQSVKSSKLLHPHLKPTTKHTHHYPGYHIFSHAIPRLLRLRISRRSSRLASEWYNLYPERICCLFETHNANFNLRKSDFVLPNFNTVTFGKHSLKYLCPKLWNRLPRKLKFTTLCINNFKPKIRKVNLEILKWMRDAGAAICVIVN